MMLTAEQDKIVHVAAVEFAVAHYKEPEKPRGSVVLAAAEEVAEGLTKGEAKGSDATREATSHAFVFKVDKVLALLRNEPEGRKAYRGGGL
jgi:hypothetical protein